MTREEFYSAMAVLEAGAGKGLRENQVDIWFDCLSDLTAGQPLTCSRPPGKTLRDAAPVFGDAPTEMQITDGSVAHDK